MRAFTKEVNITCENTELNVSESTTCKMTGNTDEAISGLQFYLTSNDKIEIQDIKTSSIWEGDGLDGNVGLYTDENKMGTFDIGTFKIKAKKGGKVKVKAEKISFSTSSFELVSLDDEIFEMKIKGNDNWFSNPIFILGIIGIFGVCIGVFFFRKKEKK